MSRWTIIDATPWGLALARRLAAGGHEVQLLMGSRSPGRLPKRVSRQPWTAAPQILDQVERVVLATRIAGLEARLEQLASCLQGDHRLLTVAPGLTPGHHFRASEAVLRLTAVKQLAVLAGAAEPTALRRKEPVALVVGSAYPTWATELQGVLASKTIRVYTSEDPIGVELSNVLSAVLAVGMGAARDLDLGPATVATELTRAVAEIDRLVVGLGGRANTAYGLAGLGALTTQLFAGQGDAIEAGTSLARGEIEAARAHGELVEAARTLSERAAAQRVRAPMVDAVNGLFEGRLGAAEALAALMSRAVRSERG